MHIKANVGVLSVTWWGESDYGNQSVSLLLDEAAKVGAKVCFHIEPFNGRSPQTVRENIQYIVDTYGDHPAFYRTHGKPLFFIYDSYLIKPAEWAKLFAAGCPPPPSFSITSCTFTSSMDLALIYNLSSYCVITNEAFIPDISRSWFAAFALRQELIASVVAHGWSEDRSVQTWKTPQCCSDASACCSSC